MLRGVDKFYNDIGIQFGVDKCRNLNLVRGRCNIQDSLYIKVMQEGGIYQYLGVKTVHRVNQQTMNTESTKNV